MPYRRILHFWAKGKSRSASDPFDLSETGPLLLSADLFVNPVAKWILLSACNIPVDRKSKDRRKLFQGTFDTLSEGQAVALFPEGTSYTEPHIMQVKDGAAWAALEYVKWAQENPNKVRKGAENVMIVPAAIVYTNKSKYRSQVSDVDVHT